MHYKTFIKNCIKNNYKNKTSFNKSLIKNFKDYRNNFLNNKIKKKINNNLNAKDDTLRKLIKIYNSKSVANEKKILIYYKKFEINLSLKKKYNYKYFKQTQKETHPSSYVYLGLLVFNIKSLDNYQKLNCILKIIDKVSIQKFNFTNFDNRLLIDLIKLEKKLLKKVGI